MLPCQYIKLGGVSAPYLSNFRITLYVIFMNKSNYHFFRFFPKICCNYLFPAYTSGFIFGGKQTMDCTKQKTSIGTRSAMRGNRRYNKKREINRLHYSLQHMTSS